MRLSRRSFVAGSLIMTAIDDPVRAAGAGPVSLTYSAGRLSWPGGETRAACGRGGVRADKREGDGAHENQFSPGAGEWCGLVQGDA